MKVSVVIPVYNQSHLTERCLKSLLRHSVYVQEVVVVDNASQDETAQVLGSFKKLFEQKKISFEVIRNESNSGFGRACNQGIRKLNGDYIVVLNNDTWLMPNWDAVLANESKKNSVDVIGPYFYEKPFSSEVELIQKAQEFTSRNFGKIRHHFVPILMFLSRRAVEKLKFKEGESKDGLFNERFFVTYEDTDLKERMERMGVRYIQTGSCFIWHHSMATRSAAGALPPLYEQEGLKIFTEIWGFDPRLKDHTFFAKMRRKWWKFKEYYGLF